jgi:hypothetical protein
MCLELCACLFSAFDFEFVFYALRGGWVVRVVDRIEHPGSIMSGIRVAMVLEQKIPG